MERVTIPDAAIPETDPETLVYCFDRWVKKVANRYQTAIVRTGAAVAIDDLIQVGRLALLRAQKRYNPSGGASFLTFSFDYLRGAMRREIEKNMPPLPLGAFVSLDEPIADDTNDTYSEIIEDKAIETAQERAERMERAAELHRAIKRLKSDTKREIIKKKWFEDKELEQVAEEMNMKKGAIYAAHEYALSKLRHDHDLVMLCAPVFSVSLSRFRRRWESAVEAEVIWRDEHLSGNRYEIEYIAEKRTWTDKQALSCMNRLKAKRNNE